MLKKLGLLACAGVMTVGILGSTSALASENEMGKFDKETFMETWSSLTQEEREQKIFDRASDIGIDTTDISLEEVRNLLQANREQTFLDKAVEGGIDISDKDIEEVKDILLEHCRQELLQRAEDLGIVTDGKTIDDLKGEVREELQEVTSNSERKQLLEEWSSLSDIEKELRLRDKAEELGIITDGKEIEEIKELIKEEREKRQQEN
ncbi:hypothetical protein [Cytobacillus sp. IB215665]|uniref:hypothetical protein n=1 Tax=Cytobacillus sp. IB215665 TaxID=3097357 RepID=UPI002A1648BC|nr:hypothetical protein [Cytobacillus sp. IB215665]MDX8366024.1 hypothetical protein [Cytobacillus sp. IB215665]